MAILQYGTECTEGKVNENPSPSLFGSQSLRPPFPDPLLPTLPAMWVLDVVAVSFALFFLTSPLIQAAGVLATPAKVRNVNPVNLLCFLVNSATQVGYGIFLPVPPIIPCSVYGTFVGLVSIATCWWFARKDPHAERWNKPAFVGTCFALILSGSIIAYAGLGGEGAAARVGYLGMYMGIIMSAAPLSALREVLQTKSSSILPFTQLLLGFLNSLCWFGVGVTRREIPIWVSNALQMLLSLVQL